MGNFWLSPGFPSFLNCIFSQMLNNKIDVMWSEVEGLGFLLAGFSLAIVDKNTISYLQCMSLKHEIMSEVSLVKLAIFD